MRKNMKAMLLAALMVLSVCLFSACGGDSQPTEAPLSPNADYKVNVTDVTGAPCPDVMAVKFMQGGKQAAMQVVKDGSAVKNMARGEYTVELQFANGAEEKYVFDAASAKLTKEITEVTIILSQNLGEQSMELFDGQTNRTAYFVSTGGTNVPLDAENRSYFIFAPTEAGLYEFSLIGSEAAIGYYGGTHMVQANNLAEKNGNTFTLSISKGNLGGSYVLGIDAGEGTATLAIKRLGEPNWSVEDEPWTEYVLKHKPVAYTLPAGTTLKQFDLTATTDTYTLVADASGFYHLNTENGPMVYVRLGKTATEEAAQKDSTAISGSGNLLPSFEVMLETSPIRCYFYDANGGFLKKEDYSENLMTYIACVDKASGLYPLTEDLQYIIQHQGEQAKWWDTESEAYLFKDSNGNRLPGINNDIAWLFMCVYAG